MGRQLSLPNFFYAFLIVWVFEINKKEIFMGVNGILLNNNNDLITKEEVDKIFGIGE